MQPALIFFSMISYSNLIVIKSLTDKKIMNHPE